MVTLLTDVWDILSTDGSICPMHCPLLKVICLLVLLATITYSVDFPFYVDTIRYMDVWAESLLGMLIANTMPLGAVNHAL